MVQQTISSSRCFRTTSRGKKFLLPSTPARKIGDIFRACAAVRSFLTMSTGETATLEPGKCKDYDVPTGQNPVLTSDMAIQVIILISHRYLSLNTIVLFHKFLMV